MNDSKKTTSKPLNESTNRVEIRGGNTQNTQKPPTSANQTLSSLASTIKDTKK
jgi:hypothetical protein